MVVEVWLTWGCTFLCPVSGWGSVPAGMTADISPSHHSAAGGGSPPAGDVLPLVSTSQDRRLARHLVVTRLLALDEAGALETVHAQIAAEAAGVSQRTVWRWLAVAP